MWEEESEIVRLSSEGRVRSGRRTCEARGESVTVSVREEGKVEARGSRKREI